MMNHDHDDDLHHKTADEAFIDEETVYDGEYARESEEDDGPLTKEELFENALASVVFANEYETLEIRGTCSILDALRASGTDQEEVIALMASLASMQQTAAGVYLECFEVLGVMAEFEEYCQKPDSYPKALQNIKNMLLWHLS